jgi:hypothetical protein
VFNLSFDVAAKTISIMGVGPVAGQDFSGKITGLSVLSEGGAGILAMAITWNTLPSAAELFLGTNSATGTGAVLTIGGLTGMNSRAVASTDLVLAPQAAVVPEPTATLLFGAGLLVIVGVVRRQQRT